MGLTAFLVAMLRTDPQTVAKADPARLAAKYDIPADRAAGYLDLYVGRVG